MTHTRRIRPIAICVFRRNGRILVAEGYDPVKRETFYRPLGGSIEFGERSEQTVIRELREEAGLEVKNLRYLAPSKTSSLTTARWVTR